MAQHSSILPFILLGAAAALVNACGSDGSGGGTGGGPAGSAGTSQAGRGGSGSSVAGSTNGGATNGGSSNGGSSNGGSSNGGSSNGGSSNGGSANGGSTNGGSANGGSSNAGAANAGAANGGHAGTSTSGGGGGNSGTSGAGAGGNPAGGSAQGGSAGSGGATGVDPKAGCSKLVFSFGLDPDDTPIDGSSSTCGGEVGDGLSTLTFDYGGFPKFSFKVQTEMGTGQTGPFATVVHVESRDLFASPWQSTSKQCSLQVTSNETFTKVARVTGSITCTPKRIPEPPPSGDTVGLDIEKWEFTTVVPLQ